jgi:hypothetical protein
MQRASILVLPLHHSLALPLHMACLFTTHLPLPCTWLALHHSPALALHVACPAPGPATGLPCPSLDLPPCALALPLPWLFFLQAGSRSLTARIVLVDSPLFHPHTMHQPSARLQLHRPHWRQHHVSQEHHLAYNTTIAQVHHLSLPQATFPGPPLLSGSACGRIGINACVVVHFTDHTMPMRSVLRNLAGTRAATWLQHVCS